MAKRRYSEDFYSEIDSLIKIHQEKSVKRFEMIEVAQSAETEEKHKTKYGYTPPTTFLEVATKNQLLKYTLIFVGILFATFLVTVAISGRMKQSRELAARDTGIVRQTESKEKRTKEDFIDINSAHETLNVSVNPVPGNWNKPQAGILKPYKDDSEKLKEMDGPAFKPKLPDEPDPSIPDEFKNSSEIMPGESFSPREDTAIPGVNPTPPGDTVIK